MGKKIIDFVTLRDASRVKSSKARGEWNQKPLNCTHPRIIQRRIMMTTFEKWKFRLLDDQQRSIFEWKSQAKQNLRALLQIFINRVLNSQVMIDHNWRFLDYLSALVSNLLNVPIIPIENPWTWPQYANQVLEVPSSLNCISPLAISRPPLVSSFCRSHDYPFRNMPLVGRTVIPKSLIGR